MIRIISAGSTAPEDGLNVLTRSRALQDVMIRGDGVSTLDLAGLLVTASVTLSGTSVTHDFRLATATTQLEGVVVTALGLEREKLRQCQRLRDLRERNAGLTGGGARGQELSSQMIK